MSTREKTGRPALFFEGQKMKKLLMVVPLLLFHWLTWPSPYAARANNIFQMVGPGGSLVDNSITPAVVLNSNTLVAHWHPSVTPNVVNYCIYFGQLSGKETKAECLPVAKLTCPVFTPPISPPIPTGDLCWMRVLQPNPGPHVRTFFVEVTVVVESAKSNEAQAIQKAPNSPAQPI